MSEHGGKRERAGRKSTGVNESKVVRVDSLLVHLVNEIKASFKETGLIPVVTTIQDNEALIEQNDALHSDNVMLRKLVKTKQSELDSLKALNRRGVESVK